jgi:hypothetical protein
MGGEGSPIPRYARGAWMKSAATVLRNPICCLVGRKYLRWMLISVL